MRARIPDDCRAANSSLGPPVRPLSPLKRQPGHLSLGRSQEALHRVTRQEALRLFTRGNSWFLRIEDKIGSIEPGKLADMVVLNKDYFDVADVEIKQIRSVLTVVDGKIVYDAGV